LGSRRGRRKVVSTDLGINIGDATVLRFPTIVWDTVAPRAGIPREVALVADEMVVGTSRGMIESSGGWRHP